ncbi:MAG TPA: cyclic nucleotide-binding domain-containing protein [Acidimicrobiales bacterium]|nr:cyclic nucleotide-binding domain-containing protein [Acidimicrobiales bacterium]
MTKLPFEAGITHYDDPPPENLSGMDVAALQADDRFRFANELTGWVEVDDGRIVQWDQGGGGHIGISRVRVGLAVDVRAVPLPELRPDVEVGDGWVRFTQTAGGRTGVPAPRTVRRAPFVQLKAPLAWSTLTLTIHADGRAEHALVGASPFPRHWVYGPDGMLSHKSGLIDFREWYRHAFGAHTPWGDEDSPALVTEVETALERDLSTRIMRGDGKPRIRSYKPDEVLMAQGDRGDELFLVLDGVVRVDVDGEPLVELGPGVVLGERALLESGVRTSTITAVTRAKVAVVAGDAVDRDALAGLVDSHRREEAGRA